MAAPRPRKDHNRSPSTVMTLRSPRVSSSPSSPSHNNPHHHPAAADATAPAGPESRASGSTSTDPRSARIEIWLDEVLRASEPPGPDSNQSPPQPPPLPPSPRNGGRAQILRGLRRLSRKLRRRSDEGRDGEAVDRTAMYSHEHGAHDELASESSGDVIAQAVRRRGERLDRARMLLERSAQG